MTKILHVKCDGPSCRREITSDVHAGTWLTLTNNSVFKDLEPTKEPYVGFGEKHFCSYNCLGEFISQKLWT